MLKAISQKINSRIAHKLALWVIIFSTLISLITTAFQLYYDFRKDLISIENYFQSISFLQLNTLSQSIWVMDDIQIQAQLNGITRGPDIIYAAVINEGKVRWLSGENDAKRTKELRYDLSYTQREKNFALGSLHVVASLDNINHRLLRRTLVILLTNTLKTFLFAGCILLFFQHAVTRHLEELASHVVNMDFRKKLLPFRLDRQRSGVVDEFSQVTNMLNIFQRRGFHAFNALEKSEMRLRLFFDATEEGILGINSEGRVTFVNSACLAMMEMRANQEIIGRRVDEIFVYRSFGDGPLEDEDAWSFAAPMVSGTTQSSDDGFLEVKEGPSFYAAARLYPIMTDGECTGAVVFFNDISEQREMLRENKLLSQAVRQSPLLVIISDKTGIIQYVNPNFEQLTGYALKEVVGKRPYFLGLYNQNRSVYRDIRQTLLSGEKWQGTFRVRAKDGAEHSFDSLVSPVFNSRGEIVNIIGLCLDISQKIELQNQLNHAHKMEAVGRLSASFAHEFGNPLLGVRSVIKDIGDRVPMERGDKQLLKLAYSECERMKVLIRDFQQFQRVSSGQKDHHDVHVILDNVLFFYKKHFEKHNISLQTDYDCNLPKVFISKDQIAQVFLNLIINAVDAMSQLGGTLTITTYKKDQEVWIGVNDTGVGIEKGNKALIFEPFFTTKPEVQGTGLGLSISYGIVAGHGGEITVVSEPGEGSTFTVQLPLKSLKN